MWRRFGGCLMTSMQPARGAIKLAKLAVPTLAAALTGTCAARSIEGMVEGGGEVFSGGSFREIDGGGVLTVRSSRGAICTGEFVYVRVRQGEGTFRCSDGRIGPFQFAATARGGTGTGHFGSKRFVFSFG
jgi:hypothetical protein